MVLIGLFSEGFWMGLSLLLFVGFVFVLFRMLKYKRFDLYLGVVNENRMIMILDKEGHIDTYSNAFKVLFPEVSQLKTMRDLIGVYPGFKDYAHETHFMLTQNGSRYSVDVKYKYNFEVIELVNVSAYMKKGAASIRELFLDFERSPMSFIVNRHGNVLSASISFNSYWRLFDAEVLVHISDIGIHDVEFVDEVFSGNYINGTRAVSIDDIEIFAVHANEINGDTFVMHFTLFGEPSYFTTGQYDVMGELVNALDDGIVAVNNTGMITFSNKKMNEFVGSSDLIGKNILSVFKLYDKENHLIPLSLPFASRVYELAWFESPLSEERLVVELIINEVLEHDGFKVGYVLNFRDTSLRQSIAMKSYRFAYRDALTGVYNRHYLKKEISEMSEMAHQFGVILLDCNGLKVVNDSFGHTMGDKIIQQTAQVLLRMKKRDDVIIRIGGDEFALLTYGYTRVEFDQLLSDIKKEMLNTHVDGLPLSVSMGSQYLEAGFLDFQSLLEKAELEMYRDKIVSGKVARDNMMHYILDLISSKLPWEKEHSDLSGQLARLIALEMELGDELVEMVYNAGKYHSIGKVGLSTEVLLGGGDSMRIGEEYLKHNELAFRILSAMPEYSYLANTILLYRENFDGSGEPHGVERHFNPSMKIFLFHQPLN